LNRDRLLGFQTPELRGKLLIMSAKHDQLDAAVALVEFLCNVKHDPRPVASKEHNSGWTIRFKAEPRAFSDAIDDVVF
jgi:hypothetical protein